MSLFSLTKHRAMYKSRVKKLDHFYSLCKTGKVLDVGVAGLERNPSANIFLKTFRFLDNFYFGLGIQPMADVKIQHPNKTFVEYSGGTMPFKTGAFEWVFSNAVIEHTGYEQDQLAFLNEMLRVGKQVFFTTPNKYFPIDSHTNSFLLHWLPGKVFFGWCSRFHNEWNKENLQLLSYKHLESLLKDSTANRFQIFKNNLLGWPMTFTVTCSND